MCECLFKLYNGCIVRGFCKKIDATQFQSAHQNNGNVGFVRKATHLLSAKPPTWSADEAAKATKYLSDPTRLSMFSTGQNYARVVCVCGVCLFVCVCVKSSPPNRKKIKFHMAFWYWFGSRWLHIEYWKKNIYFIFHFSTLDGWHFINLARLDYNTVFITLGGWHFINLAKIYFISEIMKLWW